MNNETKGNITYDFGLANSVGSPKESYIHISLKIAIWPLRFNPKYKRTVDKKNMEMKKNLQN